MTNRAGYVLVGGASIRMGTDKARLPYRGTTLAESIARAVAVAAGSATFVGGQGVNHVPDLYPGQGPLGGILTALRHSDADWNLIVACDMPGLTPDFLHKLLEAAEACGADALIPAGPAGLEPLCAAYRKRAYAGLSAAFDRGVRKISAALEEVQAVTWPVPELAHFQNVNTPEEWAPYAR